MSDKKKKDGEELIGAQKIERSMNSFLTDNKTPLIIIGCAIILAVIILIIVFKVNDTNLAKQFDTIDQLETTYTEVSALDPTGDDYKTKSEDLKKQLTTLSSGKKYPALKANYLLSMLAFEEKDYQTALDGFFKVYQKANGSYLGSLALTNAAVAAEEKGDDALALEYYTKVWDEFGTKAAEAPKALFNQARLQQKKGDTTIAKATYQQLIDQFPQSDYTKLAQSIIILL